MSRSQSNASERNFRIASRSAANVLITGPTGVGKSELARKIHQAGPRSSRSFVAVNLATLHAGTFESELFGHERGAFTGADQRRVGKLELAQGGTVFLDEIGELTPQMQCRLLEFLQSRIVTPMGSNREISLDVRVIAATHRDLEDLVRRGLFREDLLHRLRVLSISLPALSEMPERFDEIVHTLLAQLSASHRRPVLRLAEEVAVRLESHCWPGNFRELRNVLEYAILASEGSEIRVEDLPDWFRAAKTTPLQEGASLPQVAELAVSTYTNEMDEFERGLISRSLRRYHGRISLTARRLRMSKTTLLRRMKVLQIGINPEGEVILTSQSS